jgi:hypothetical protein
MTTKVDYVPLGGGLNLIDSQLTMKPGMMTECLNYEQIFGSQGYWRIAGFERYDGRLEPHLATYYVQEFDTGTAAISVGDIVTGTSASAEVLLVELETGSWVGGDAAGRLILGNVTGAWANNDNIKVSAVTKALASAATHLGSIGETLNSTYRALAVEDRRTAIQKPAGEGAILGIGVANDVVYCVRNAVGSNTAVLYKATGSGWTMVKSGLYPGGDVRMIQANFSGSSTSLYLFGADGMNRSWKYDGTTFSFMAPIYGSQGTSTSSNTIGTGAKTFTIAESSRSWVANDTLILWSTANAGNRMTGTVTSYTSGTNTLVMNITATVGSGTITDWEIGKADFSDKPFELAAHRDHMFLCYPYGQLQTSNLGDPMTYTSTAALIGVGDDLDGLVSMKGGLLAIYCDERTYILEGSDKTTWQLTANSYSSGARFKTVQEIAQSVVALDDRGLTSLQATQNFGSFEMSIFSRMVKPYLDAILPYIIGSKVVRTKNQYRIYSSTGVVITVTVLTPNAVITPEDIAVTRCDYNTAISCSASGTIDDAEVLFFGTTDGYVMREDVGTSFDGVEIPSVTRLPFNSFKSPSNKKRFRKLVMELDAPSQTTLNFRQLFDYGDGKYAPSINQSSSVQGGGGQWDVDSWDTFLWSMPVQTQVEANVAGVGRNMALLIWHESALDEPFNIQGLLVHHSILGLAR